MKLGKIMALAFAAVVTLTSTVMAADNVKIGAYYYFDRAEQVGMYRLGNEVAKLPKADVPKASKHLLATVEGYNIYMDIPEWMAKEHTKDGVIDVVNGKSFYYGTKNPYVYIEALVSKNAANEKIRGDIAKAVEKDLPQAGEKLSNGTEFTAEMRNDMINKFVTINMLGNIARNYAEAYKEDLESVVISPTQMDGKYVVLEKNTVAKERNNSAVNDSSGMLLMEGDDAVVININYGKDISEKDMEAVNKSVLSLKVEKAK